MTLGSTEPLPFVIGVGRLGGATVVAVAGELDLHTAPELEHALAEADGKGHVVVDLTEVSFLDSTALAVLLRAASMHRETLLDIVADGTEVRRVFEITGLDRRFAFARTLEEALER